MGVARRTFLLTPFALAAAERKPNLVLLIARGWRGLDVPWARDAEVKAPTLERLAREGVVFPRAYSCYPRPTPARAAIVTGRYPHTTGVIKDRDTLPPGESTLESVLKDAGYRVGQTVEAPFFAIVLLEEPMGPALDREMGRLAESTILVFTSDCGAQRGAHDLEGDDVFFEESVRIPLAIRYPGVLPRGLASDLIVSQVDIMPTLLGLCGEAAPEGVQGRDLSPLLTGGKGVRPESVYGEGRIGRSDEWRMLVLGADKLVVNAQKEVTHLYNLTADPYEQTNLARDGTVKLKRDGLLAQLREAARHFADFKRR